MLQLSVNERRDTHTQVNKADRNVHERKFVEKIKIRRESSHQGHICINCFIYFNRKEYGGKKNKSLMNSPSCTIRGYRRKERRKKEKKKHFGGWWKVLKIV